ncbi:MAG: phosphotransferase, partial [Rickettsiales bacterium]|nr:phosphotransferase [Rickettsiales bacterium]
MTATPAIHPERLEQITNFLNTTAFERAELAPLAGDASFRRYIRVHKDGQKAMLMDAPVDKEDVRPFMAVAQYIHDAGYSAPKLLASHVPHGLLLLEDLGNDSFTLLLKQQEAKAELERTLYAAAIDLLSEWHDEGRGFSAPSRLPLPVYNNELLLREVALLPDWFLPQVVGREKAALLKAEYMAIWERILSAAPLSTRVLVHRDYHADNLMWLPARSGSARVGLLDFQDGVYGDAAYDMVSLLEDARRDVPAPLVEEMLTHYIANSSVNDEKFRTAYATLGAQRNCKIVGIFARLAARDGKLHYLNYLPRVWRHLENDLSHPRLKELKHWLDTYVPAESRGVIALR